MGFLDNVKDALKDAVSSQASKDEEAKKDDVVADEVDTTTADDSATPAPPMIPVDTDTDSAGTETADTETAEPTVEPTTEPTVGPVRPADSVVPAPTREDAREKREDAREAEFETYTVKSGDSLSEIGARFGVPYLEIAKLNKIENPDLIFPGQVFRIPKN